MEGETELELQRELAVAAASAAGLEASESWEAGLLDSADAGEEEEVESSARLVREEWKSGVELKFFAHREPQTQRQAVVALSQGLQIQVKQLPFLLLLRPGLFHPPLSFILLPSLFFAGG